MSENDVANIRDAVHWSKSFTRVYSCLFAWFGFTVRKKFILFCNEV